MTLSCLMKREQDMTLSYFTVIFKCHVPNLLPNEEDHGT